MLTTINGDNGTYLNIDMWYDDEFVPGKFGASVVFSDLDAEYRGNIYSENGEMIGDFTSDDSVLVEQNFNIGWVDDDDIDHWNGVNASTDIEASDSGVCQYVRDELAKVEKTLSTTTADPDSYNMGWLDGRRTALRDVLTHCPQDINSATEPKYTADMCSIGASGNIGTELKARPIIYLPLNPGETHEDAVMRMTDMLYDAGFDILNESLNTDNTEIQ